MVMGFFFFSIIVLLYNYSVKPLVTLFRRSDSEIWSIEFEIFEKSGVAVYN